MSHVKKRLLLGAVGILALSACGKDGVPVMGLDDTGKEVVVRLKDGAYSKHLGNFLDNVQQATTPVLAKHDQAKGWMLRTVVVGIGVNTEGGIGPYKIGGVTRFKLAFTNSADPVVP